MQKSKDLKLKTASSAVMELKNEGVDAGVIGSIMAQIYCNQTDGIHYKEIEGTEEGTVFCIEKGNVSKQI